MILRWLLAAVHLLALGIGLGAVLDRAWSLRTAFDDRAIRSSRFRAGAPGLHAAPPWTPRKRPAWPASV
jgi:hypothetical protein